MEQAKQRGELVQAQKQDSNWKWSGLIKNVAIAGAAVASSPVLAPPLLLFSVLGLAFAFPFALYLAGIAGTHKLMSYLFSPQNKDTAAAAGEEASEEKEGEEMKQEGNAEAREGAGTDASAAREIEIVEPKTGKAEDEPAESEGKAAEHKENKEEKEGEDQAKSKKGKSKKSK